MKSQGGITIEQSGAFVEAFEIAPTADGPLSGLTFAVKDLIDIAGRKTGCGNPSWLKSHPPARSNAVCVDQLLNAGGRFVGKTITDEVAFSLIGENHFYGTPLNPAAPDRVPGGSSSGSGSAVACGLADFAIGTDTGGSVRFPASNCGIWGLRPSHGFISVAGLMPFAPTFDTVGVLARSADVLGRAASALLATQSVDAAGPRKIYILQEAFELADQQVQQAHRQTIQQLQKLFGPVLDITSFSQILGDAEPPTFDAWFDTYCTIQWGEIENSLGAWIAETNPQFGPVATKSLELVKNLDRRLLSPAIAKREHFYRSFRRFLGPRDLLCIPTTPAPAPLKSSLGVNQRVGDYYRRALSLTSIAGLCRLPQVSMPLSSVPVATSGDKTETTLPLGLSLLGSFGEDVFLLDVASAIAAALGK